MLNLSCGAAPKLTCHGQLGRAEVTAKLVAGRDHQLTYVSALHALYLQGVLNVVRHAHLIRSWFVDQHHAPPEERMESDVKSIR